MTGDRLYAVLTGDIVKSSSLDSDRLESVREHLLHQVDVARGWKRGIVKGQAEFFRGDAWQVLLSDVSMALRVGVLLRSGLLAQGTADTRFSIGIGRVEKISRRVSLSTGQAFVLSGHGLDSLTLYSRINIRCPESAGPLADWLPVVGQLCDAVMNDFTERQAQVVTLAVNPRDPTHETIAGKLDPPVSKQSVTKALDAANWNALRTAIRTFEQTDWNRAVFC